MEIAELLPPQSFDLDPVLDFEAGLERAARAQDLEPWVLQRIKHPEREITINIPSVHDDGTAINITAYRIQHSRAQGPCIGPVLLSPSAHPARLRNEAATITLQSALLELPLGGGAGAIVCDSATVSETELRRVLDEYVSTLREDTGPLTDVLVPFGPQWLVRGMAESAAHVRGRHEPAAVITGRTDSAAGAAIVALIHRVLETRNSANLRVVVQGYGNRARTLIAMLHREGARIVAVADRSGGVLRKDGLDVAELGAYVEDHGVVFGFPNAQPGSNADVLECDCDLLVLAAAERQVGSHNAQCIRARTVVELTPNAVIVEPEHLPSHCTLVPHLLCGTAEIATWFYQWQRSLTYSDVDAHDAARFATERVLSAFDRTQSNEANSLLDRARFTSVSRLAQTLRR